MAPHRWRHFVSLLQPPSRETTSLVFLWHFYMIFSMFRIDLGNFRNTVSRRAVRTSTTIAKILSCYIGFLESTSGVGRDYTLLAVLRNLDRLMSEAYVRLHVQKKVTNNESKQHLHCHPMQTIPQSGLGILQLSPNASLPFSYINSDRSLDNKHVCAFPTPGFPSRCYLQSIRVYFELCVGKSFKHPACGGRGGGLARGCWGRRSVGYPQCRSTLRRLYHTH